MKLLPASTARGARKHPLSAKRAFGSLRLVALLGLSLCLVSAVKCEERKLRGGSVSQAFLSHLSLNKAAGLSAEELEKKIKTDPLLLREIVAATAAAAANAVDAPAPNKGIETLSSSDPLAVEEEAQSCATTTSISEIRVGNAMSQGSTPKGQEFLGVGYNALTGNPRGDMASNFDPGFGFRVLTLTNSSRNVRGLAEPDIAVIKPTKLCSFSSEAKDISSVKDMQDTLNKESSDDTKVSASVKAFGAGFDSTTQFSKSEKLNKFKQEKETEETVSFEASAMCIDFRMTINPYITKTIDGDFQGAIDSLATAMGDDATYDSSTHGALFAQFFKYYGTHYIKEIDMGGKYIITSDMTSKDVSSLTTEKVDIASTLSFSASFSFAKAKKASNANDLLEQKREYYKPTCCGGNMTKPPSKKIMDDTGLFGAVTEAAAPLSVSVSVQSTHKRSSSRTSRDEESVKSKITKESTYTLGGLPPTDEKWETWAASVEVNPMPVAYKYAPLWELAELADIKDAYLDAAFDIYGVHLIGIGEYGEPAFRNGVVRASGEPISKYSAGSDRRTSVSLTLELSSSTELALDTVPVYVNEEESQDVPNSWSSYATATEVEEGFFACGLRAKIDPKVRHLVHLNPKGLTGLDVRFCSIEKWSNQEAKEVYQETNGWVQPWKMCQKGQYIVQIKPSVEFDRLGIESLKIKCATIDGHSSDQNGDGFHDIVPSWPSWAERIGTFTEAQPNEVIPGQLIRSIRAQNEEGSRKGIKGMEIMVGHADVSETYGGPPSPIYYYRSYWDLRTSKVSPIFATPIRGKISKSAHESNQLSFTSKRGALTVESLSLYAYMDEATRPKLAVTDFKNDISESDLQSFGMLVSSDLSKEAEEFYGLQGRFLRGVVHPDGSGMSVGPNQIDYEVEYEHAEKPSLATLILKGLSSSHVSLLVTPIWFPIAGEGKYPINAGDVAIATSQCNVPDEAPTEWRCYVHVGSEGNPRAAGHLGFSFMALGLNDDTATASQGTKKAGYHGSVIVKKGEDGYEVDIAQTKKSEGVTVDAAFNEGRGYNVMVGEGDLVQINVNNQVTGGIKLTFSPPFKDIPTIIVSPIIDKEASLSRYAMDILSLPSAVVEHITTKEALIRVGMVDTYQTGVKATLEDSCASTSNVHQTFTAAFRKPGTIKIGGTPEAAGKCFTRKEGSFLIDAEHCVDGANNQQWVYDGTRIRSYTDPSKCIWGRGQNERLAIHTCLSDADRRDDERLNFHKHTDTYMNIDTMYSRCLYLDENHIRFSSANDSRCWGGQNPEWSGIEVVDGFATDGFQIKASEEKDNKAVDFNLCLSWLPSKNKLNPLSSCESSTTHQNDFLLSMDTSWASDDTYKLKLANVDWPIGELSNVADAHDLYLGKDSSGELVMSEINSSTTSMLAVDFQVIFENARKSQGTQLVASRLQIGGNDECVAWNRSLQEAGEYEVEDLFTPVSFSFAAVGPLKPQTAANLSSDTVAMIDN